MGKINRRPSNLGVKDPPFTVDRRLDAMIFGSAFDEAAIRQYQSMELGKIKKVGAICNLFGKPLRAKMA